MMAVILHDRVYVVLPDGAESGAIRAVSAGLRRLLRPASPPPAPPTSQASHHPADESGGGGRNVSVTINEGGGGDGSTRRTANAAMAAAAAAAVRTCLRLSSRRSRCCSKWCAPISRRAPPASS